MKAKWIWIDNNILPDTYGEFIDTIKYENEKTTIKISADSDYSIEINNKFVYAGQYPDFPWYKIHDEIDVSSYLQKGDNQLKITIWHCGDDNFNRYNNRPGLLYSVIQNGEEIAFSSQKTQCRKAPYFVSEHKKMIVFQLGYSFMWNANLIGEKYNNAVEIDGMAKDTEIRPIKLLTIGNPLEAKHIGNNIYDLGKEVVGLPYVEYFAKKGEVITIAFGERIKEDGDVPRRLGGRDFSFELVGSGKKEKMFNPLRKLGFRYFQIFGDCEISSIGMLPMQYPFVETGYKTENALREKIYNTSVRTLLCNALEHYYDCPWREQGYYGLDSRFQMRYGYQAFNGTEYQRAALKLMAEDKMSEGFFSMVVPSSDKSVIPSFALFYIIAMVEYAEQSGDYSLIGQYYYKLKSMIDLVLANEKDGLIYCFKGLWNFYEWKETLQGDLAEPLDSVLNLDVLFMLINFERACKKIGKIEDANFFEEKIISLRENIYNTFYCKENKLFKTFVNCNRFSELVNSMAILCEVITGKDAEHIADLLANGSNMIETTLSMTALKYDALIKVDKDKYANVILSHIDKMYEFMLNNGATTFWETLLGAKDFNGAGSLCHGWSAMPIYYYKKLEKKIN